MKELLKVLDNLELAANELLKETTEILEELDQVLENVDKVLKGLTNEKGELQK